MGILKKIGTIILYCSFFGCVLTSCLLSFGRGDFWSWRNFYMVFTVVFVLLFCAKAFWFENDEDEFGGLNLTAGWPPVLKKINSVIGDVVASLLLTIGWLFILALLTLGSHGDSILNNDIVLFSVAGLIFFGQLIWFYSSNKFKEEERRRLYDSE